MLRFRPVSASRGWAGAWSVSALGFGAGVERLRALLRTAEAWSGPLQSAREIRDAGPPIGEAARTAVKIEDGYLELGGVRVRVRGRE